MQNSAQIREILAKLDETELYSLVSTVTQGLLKNKINSTDGRWK